MTFRRIILVVVLILFCMTYSICNAIRYGFLADAFERRGIPGKLFGLLESSVFLGFVIMYFSKGTELVMKVKGHRYIFAAILFTYTAIALSTGFVYLLESNFAVLLLSFLLRILLGVVTYACNLVPVDFIHAHFPDLFDLINSVSLMGCFCGHGIAESVGCLLYDVYGYVVPFIFAASLTFLVGILVLFTFPDSGTYLASQDKFEENREPVSSSFDSEKTSSSRLTWALIFPLIATMLINANHGVLQVSVTPFLHQNFGVSISFAGRCLVFVAVGMAVGGLLTGVLLQSKIFCHYTVMAIGTFCLFVGLLLTFPSPYFGMSFYRMAPITAFPGVFLAGLGDPLVTISTLTALYDLQELKKGKLSPEVSTMITGIWLNGYCAFYYGGPFIAGLMDDYLTYPDSALILASMCAIAFIICVVMRSVTAKIRARNQCNEETPILRDTN